MTSTSIYVPRAIPSHRLRARYGARPADLVFVPTIAC